MTDLLSREDLQAARFKTTSIEGVVLKQLQTHSDERGFFREVIRDSDEFFDGFAQWSHSMMFTGTIKAWHIHQRQTDWWYCPIGVIRAVVCNVGFEWKDVAYWNGLSFQEFVLGEYHQQVLKIPPGVAHGLKVLQGPAHLFYITSNEYDGTDEGRIPQDALGYDWNK